MWFIERGEASLDIKYEKSKFSSILPFFSSLCRSGIFFSFKNRASFMGNPVYAIQRGVKTSLSFLHLKKSSQDLSQLKEEVKTCLGIKQFKRVS